MKADDRHDNPEVQRTARMMAAAAGLVWDRFEKYPGYYRILAGGTLRAGAACLAGEDSLSPDILTNNAYRKERR